MAQYRLSVQTIQRAMGRSAVAAAAYRSGASLTDERLAMEFDFANKADIEHAEIMLPPDARAVLRDRQALWNSAEASETRKDAVPAREVLISLPHELDFEQRRELVRAFVQQEIVARGMIADFALHRPGKTGDDRNFHAHILVTTRGVGPQGLGRKETTWRTPQQVRDWREGWAKIQNEHLRRHLGPEAPQVSHLSLAEQGIDRAPTVHLGPTATALERKNIASERGEQNRDVKARNKKVREVHVAFEETVDRLARREPEVVVAIGELVKDARELRAEMIADRDAWMAERKALTAPKIPSPAQIERAVTAEAAAARARARLQLQETQERVKRTRLKRLELMHWVRNPVRMIWAKHAEMNALDKVREACRRAEVQLQVRRDWLRSTPGRAYASSRRQPQIDEAADVARRKRTLERKIKRMDRRIEAATRTYNELRVAEELGVRSLRVPSSSPDATRFMRDVGAPARQALSQYPEAARQMAIQRLNRGQGRTISRTIFPSP